MTRVHLVMLRALAAKSPSVIFAATRVLFRKLAIEPDRVVLAQGLKAVPA